MIPALTAKAAKAPPSITQAPREPGRAPLDGRDRRRRARNVAKDSRGLRGGVYTNTLFIRKPAARVLAAWLATPDRPSGVRAASRQFDRSFRNTDSSVNLISSGASSAAET